MAFDELAAINSFWSSRLRGVFFPTEWFNRLTLDDAYRIQLGLIDRRCTAGECQIGWKVEQTTEQIREPVAFREPLFGCVLDCQRSGHVFRRRELISPGFEPGLCMHVSQQLGGDVSLLDVCRAVDAVYPALEIIENRGDFVQQTAVGVADNVRQKTIVIGNPVVLGGMELNNVEATVEINGTTVATGRGDAVMGNPLNSLVWLAHKLAEFGRGIRADDLIMTGSFTDALPIEPGERAYADFAGIGDVQACVLS
jgi:2-keto-4-pentenoate hydratase